MVTELLIALAVTLVAYVYSFCKSKFAYFKEKGIRNIPPLPIIGNLKDVLLKTRHAVYIYDDIYNAFPDERIAGIFEFMSPVYMIRDPELIKHITVKDFDHFVDHRTIFSEDTDPIFGSSLFSIKGDRWREMRSTLSPAFTGSKIRNMCPFMVECGQQVVEYLRKECIKQKSSDGPGVELEMKDLYTRFATDVIASTAFGVKVDSLAERNNDFFVTGKKMSTFTGWQILKLQIGLLFPKVAKLLGLSVFHPSITTFFRNIFVSTVKYREENKIVRPDIINILMEVKKGSLDYESHDASDDTGFATVQESEIGKRHSKRVWTDDELSSQVFLFFFAGFDTISSMLSFVTIELALNPDVQDKLRAEIDATYPEDGNLTYEHVQKMVYLDMVVSESLRTWAPMPMVDRECLKTYHVPGKDGEKSTLTIEKGAVCQIPIFSLHRDPKYWEEPTKFNPERFSPENKDKIIPFTYLPFGSGPRNCIGSRFALMEVKIILFYIIRNFKLLKTPKTTNPLIINSITIGIGLKEGFWMNLVTRNDI